MDALVFRGASTGAVAWPLPLTSRAVSSSVGEPWMAKVTSAETASSVAQRRRLSPGSQRGRPPNGVLVSMIRTSPRDTFSAIAMDSARRLASPTALEVAAAGSPKGAKPAPATVMPGP
jgi:hypothetical protein